MGRTDGFGIQILGLHDVTCRLIQNDIALLQYPSASATAVILLITVLILIGTLLRFVDIRKEL